MALAGARCSPRHVIAQSGILRALVSHPQFKASYLTQHQVEFCQLALLAGHYRYAARCLAGHAWPRPSPTIAVRHVLRYFLLRGMIHTGCNDWTNATRCFWTVLSVPAEIVSALAIAAWKKLILVQCLQMDMDDYRAAQEYERKLQQQQEQQQQQQSALVVHHHQQQQQLQLLMDQQGRRGPFSLPKAVPSCLSRFLSMALNDAKQARLQKQQQQQQQQQQHPEDASIMVQEEPLGDPSQRQAQQQQRLPNSQQQQQQQVPFLGVKVYMDLVQAFVSGDRASFQTTMNQHTTLLETDGNFGLVRQCETTMIHRQVYQLSRMYSVLPVTKVAAKLNMNVEAVTTLLQQLSLDKTMMMMMSGSGGSTKKSSRALWPNIMVEEDGMVVFDFDSPTSSRSSTISSSSHQQDAAVIKTMLMQDEYKESELENNILQLIKLTQDVEALDISIATSPLYHALIRRAQDAKMGGPRGVEEL